MLFLIPRIVALVFCGVAFLIGLRLQKQERQRREQRRKQTVTIIGGVSTIIGQYSATQAMNPGDNPQALGRLEPWPEERAEGQKVQPRFKN